MAEPELLVDEADRLVSRRALVAGDADVGKRRNWSTLSSSRQIARNSYCAQLPWKLATISSSPERS
jgi:hypothetical protein